MPEVDEDFKPGAVRLVCETGKPIAQVARELGINGGRWGTGARRSGAGMVARDVERGERKELHRLRKEYAELRMRCDVLKRSVALWVEDATRR